MSAEQQTIPCGGCGAKMASERCIGCLHDFGTPDSAWVQKVFASKPQEANMSVDQNNWKYEVRYGPDGEDVYSWLYDDHGTMIAPMKTDMAILIVNAMNTRPTETPALEVVGWQRLHPTDGWTDCRAEDIEHYRGRGQAIRTLTATDQASRIIADKDARIEELELQLSASKETAKIKRVEYLDLDQDHSELKADYAVSEAQLNAVMKALEATHEAISEYYRYQTGGEMRGSYDGKPERNALWKSMYQARAVLGGKPS